MTNPLLEVQSYGQSLWYDYIRRGLIISGELQKLIDEDGLRGVTSNPSIFEKVIAGSTDYNNALEALEKQKDMEVKSLYESLAINDVQDASDLMSFVYENTKKRDAEIIGGAAGVGAAIGAIAGGRKGAAEGAVAGGGAGTGAVLVTKGKEVVLASESKLKFTLSKSVELAAANKG